MAILKDTRLVSLLEGLLSKKELVIWRPLVQFLSLSLWG
jgi:hypothetical protein